MDTAHLRMLRQDARSSDLALDVGNGLLTRAAAVDHLVDAADAAPGGGYRVFGEQPEQVRPLLAHGLAAWLREHPGFYLEIRDNVLLAFRPGREIEEPEQAVQWLFAFTELLTRPSVRGAQTVRERTVT